MLHVRRSIILTVRYKWEGAMAAGSGGKWFFVLVKLVSPTGFTVSVFTEVTEGIFCMALSLKNIHLFSIAEEIYRYLHLFHLY